MKAFAFGSTLVSLATNHVLSFVDGKKLQMVENFSVEKQLGARIELKMNFGQYLI